MKMIMSADDDDSTDNDDKNIDKDDVDNNDNHSYENDSKNDNSNINDDDDNKNSNNNNTLKWPGSNRVEITCNTLGAYHVQHVCHVVQSGSSAIKFDRVEISHILALFYWLKPLTGEGGEETRALTENPMTTSFRRCHKAKTKNSSLKRDSNSHSCIRGRRLFGKQAR